MQLKIQPGPYRREEITVVDGYSLVPIPFKWIDHDTIEVDDCFETAAIQLRPVPRSQRDRLS